MKVETLPVDDMMQRYMNQRAAALKAKREADPAYQRGLTISKDQARAEAVEWLAKEIKDFWYKNGVACPSYEQARREACRIANRAVNQMEFKT